MPLRQTASPDRSTLIVRNLDPALVQELKARAVQHGRSAEAEHRAILEEVLRPRDAGLKERMRRLRLETRGRLTEDSVEIIRAERDREVR